MLTPLTIAQQSQPQDVVLLYLFATLEAIIYISPLWIFTIYALWALNHARTWSFLRFLAILMTSIAAPIGGIALSYRIGLLVDPHSYEFGNSTAALCASLLTAAGLAFATRSVRVTVATIAIGAATAVFIHKTGQDDGFGPDEATRFAVLWILSCALWHIAIATTMILWACAQRRKNHDA